MQPKQPSLEDTEQQQKQQTAETSLITQPIQARAKTVEHLLTNPVNEDKYDEMKQ